MLFRRFQSRGDYLPIYGRFRRSEKPFLQRHIGGRPSVPDSSIATAEDEQDRPTRQVNRRDYQQDVRRTLASPSPDGISCSPKDRPGALFQFHDGQALKKPRFTKEIRNAIDTLGLNGREYAGHSFRIGATTTAAECGIEDSVISSVQMEQLDLSSVHQNASPPSSTHRSFNNICIHRNRCHGICE